MVVVSQSRSHRTINGGALTYGAVTINNNSTPGDFNILQGNTFASLTVGSGVVLLFQQAATTTITNAFNVTGTSSAPSAVFSASNGNIATITVGAASTVQWAAIHRITETAGGSSITATNSFDLGVNTNISISPPSAAGGSGSRCIGC